MYTSGTTTTKTENDNTDSDSTEPYDIYENIIGTIYYYTPLPSATNSSPQLSASQMTKDGASIATHLPFKCPMRNCKARAKNGRKLVIITDSLITNPICAKFAEENTQHHIVSHSTYINTKN